MNDRTKKTFVLKCDDEVLGVIIIEIPTEKEYAQFGLFAMDQKYSGKKLGRLLIDHVENYAFERGKKIMKIHVFAFATQLADYYKQLGYSFTGNTTNFFHGNCIKPEFENSQKLYLNEMIKIIG